MALIIVLPKKLYDEQLTVGCWKSSSPTFPQRKKKIGISSVPVKHTCIWSSQKSWWQQLRWPHSPFIPSALGLSCQRSCLFYVVYPSCHCSPKKTKIRALYHKYSEYLLCTGDCTDKLKALALCRCVKVRERHSKTHSIADDAMHYGKTKHVRWATKWVS